jgi:Cdc6-like AAA superfamily ATPase
MRGKRVLRAIIIVLLFSLAVVLAAQGQKAEQKKGSFWDDAWKILLGAIVGGAGIKYIEFFFRSWFDKKKKQAEKAGEIAFEEKQQAHAAKTAEEIYKAALKEELGVLHLLGSPDIENQPVNLDDVFVSLRISEAWKSDQRFDADKEMLARQREFAEHRHLEPPEVMRRAFEKYRLLLIIGDPGSGKTTLLKFYAMHCLDAYKKRYRQLGFRNGYGDRQKKRGRERKKLTN